MRRMNGLHVTSYAELFPTVGNGQLIKGTGPALLQAQFEQGKAVLAAGGCAALLSPKT